MKKVAIIGTQGVPANYGGFESLVENLIDERFNSSKVKYDVFCSKSAYKNHIKSYKEADLKYINLKANGSQSIIYDILSMIKSIRGYETILVLGTSGCIFLPIFKLLSKSRVVVNIDGLEHKREKWGRVAKLFLKVSEYFAVRFSDAVIADNKGIVDYVEHEYGLNPYLIAYGGDHVIKSVDKALEIDILKKYDLIPNNYAISVCRIEPENNTHIILEAFARTNINLLFIGNWMRSDYGKKLKEQYSSFANLKLLNPIYDLETLQVLRSNANMYVHGHSAGGTNPSLVEAMFFDKPIVAFDVVYNRATTKNKAVYFKDSNELEDIISKDDCPAQGMRDVADKEYKWKNIVELYENIL